MCDPLRALNTACPALGPVLQKLTDAEQKSELLTPMFVALPDCPNLLLSFLCFLPLCPDCVPGCHLTWPLFFMSRSNAPPPWNLHDWTESLPLLACASLISRRIFPNPLP